MKTRFAWDPAKAERHWREDGVSFETARKAFGGPNQIVTENCHFADEREPRVVRSEPGR
jgi:uncharacterized DUF497 family protein